MSTWPSSSALTVLGPPWSSMVTRLASTPYVPVRPGIPYSRSPSTAPPPTRTVLPLRSERLVTPLVSEYSFVTLYESLSSAGDSSSTSKPSGSASPRAAYTSSLEVAVESASYAASRLPVYSGMRSMDPSSSALR